MLWKRYSALHVEKRAALWKTFFLSSLLHILPIFQSLFVVNTYSWRNGGSCQVGGSNTGRSREHRQRYKKGDVKIFKESRWWRWKVKKDSQDYRRRCAKKGRPACVRVCQCVCAHSLECFLLVVMFAALMNNCWIFYFFALRAHVHDPNGSANRVTFGRRRAQKGFFGQSSLQQRTIQTQSH